MDISRRGFFKSFSASLGNGQEEWRPIRPPYNEDISLFQKECTLCETKPCITACDEEIIKTANDGTVYVDFSKRGCTYCEACSDICDRNVLVSYKSTDFIQADLKLDMTKCMAWHGVICSACRDVCYDRAITFLGMLRPEINENCTSCGFCIGVCPSFAISATAREEIL
jgi:ferredoxin-type protein NapF